MLHKHTPLFKSPGALVITQRPQRAYTRLLIRRVFLLFFDRFDLFDCFDLPPWFLFSTAFATAFATAFSAFASAFASAFSAFAIAFAIAFGRRGPPNSSHLTI